MSPVHLATIFLIVGFVVAAGLTASLIPVLRRLAVRNGWVDRPDGKRKLHSHPVPSVGGVAIASGFFAGWLCLSVLNELFSSFTISLDTSFLIGAVMTTAVGFYDDLKGAGFKTKFLAQVVIAVFLIQAGYRIDLSWMIDMDPYNEVLYSAGLTLLWIVGIMNAVNLIDGLDGLAGGVAMIAFISLGSIFGIHGDIGLVAIAVVMVGALLAFLAFNFNPASIFMGDTGSLFLGYVIAASSLHGPAHVDPMIALLVPVMVLGLPVLDTTLSVVRRFSRGHSICAPDRDHLHHRLSRMWEPRRAVMALYCAAAFFGIIGVFMAVSTPPMAFGLVGVASVTTFFVVRRLGYEPATIAQDIKRRFVVPKLQPMPDEAVQLETAIPNGLDFPSNADNGASTGDGMSTVDVPVPSLDYPESEPGLDSSSVLALEEDVKSADVEGETVLLCQRTGACYGLNQAASEILQLLEEEPRSIDSIVENLERRFPGDRGRLQNDIVGFLDQMRKHRLVRDARSAGS